MPPGSGPDCAAPHARAGMFVLVEMVDTVRIPPWQFERKLDDSIAEELNKKLANKVLGGSSGPWPRPGSPALPRAVASAGVSGAPVTG